MMNPSSGGSKFDQSKMVRDRVQWWLEMDFLRFTIGSALVVKKPNTRVPERFVGENSNRKA